jgi:hypothetical protein
MTNPITPPPELVQQWASESLATQNLCNRASQWGADTELEAIQKEIITQAWFADPGHRLAQLRAARRPKPPSLKEQALARTAAILNDPNRALLVEVRETLELALRALEQLPE